MKALKRGRLAMSRRLARMTILLVLIAVGGGVGPAGAQSGLARAREENGDRRGSKCSDQTVRGTYAIQMQGTRPVPLAVGGDVEAVIGVIIRTYDGAGGFTQIDNVKGSVTGIEPDRPGSGTYQVNEDCTGTTRFQPGPGPMIEERMVIVDAGREIRSITASPLPVMVSTVQLRIERR
jgi:hypothetical protein